MEGGNRKAYVFGLKIPDGLALNRVISANPTLELRLVGPPVATGRMVLLLFVTNVTMRRWTGAITVLVTAEKRLKNMIGGEKRIFEAAVLVFYFEVLVLMVTWEVSCFSCADGAINDLWLKVMAPEDSLGYYGPVYITHT